MNWLLPLEQRLICLVERIGKILRILVFLHVVREIVSLDSILYPRIVTIAYDSQENYDVEVVIGGVLTNLYMDSTTTYFHRTVAQLHYDDL